MLNPGIPKRNGKREHGASFDKLRTGRAWSIGE